VRRFDADAQARGQLCADIDLDLLMLMLVRARELIEDPALQRIQPAFPQLVESMMRPFFYGIVPRPDAAAGEAPGGRGGRDE
jgi:hypothetical protein